MEFCQYGWLKIPMTQVRIQSITSFCYSFSSVFVLSQGSDGSRVSSSGDPLSLQPAGQRLRQVEGNTDPGDRCCNFRWCHSHLCLQCCAQHHIFHRWTLRLFQQKRSWDLIIFPYSNLNQELFEILRPVIQFGQFLFTKVFIWTLESIPYKMFTSLRCMICRRDSPFAIIVIPCCFVIASFASSTVTHKSDDNSEAAKSELVSHWIIYFNDAISCEFFG